MQSTGLWHKKTWSKRLFTMLTVTNPLCIGVNPVLALELWKKFFDQEVNEHEGDGKFNYCLRDTTDGAILTAFIAPYKEHKESLIDFIDDLTRHSLSQSQKLLVLHARRNLKLPLEYRILQVTRIRYILLGIRW